MQVRVLLFAGLAERIGERSLEVTVEDGSRVETLLERLSRDYPILSDYPYTLALNGEYSDASHPLGEGDEVALIPPVSGG